MFYTLLALWRNCPRETEQEVLQYLGKAGKHCMKFKGAEFVEFLRRVLDYPRRDMLNATNPDFSELVNKTIATACGAKVLLAPETFYEFTPPQNNSQKWKSKWNQPSASSSTRKETKESKKIAQGGQQSRKQAEHVVVPLGPEKTPLDGMKTYYVGGPFKNPKEKLEVNNCCHCWNAGKPCKYLAADGLTCRKLHICSHIDCRTLHHHGHRLAHHKDKAAL